MATPNFSIAEIQDNYVQRNFKFLKDFFRINRQLVDFRHYVITFKAAQTNFRYAHGLGFLPQDIIKTKFTGEGNLTFNYDNFTDKEFDITTTGACSIRFFAGTYNG
jgi:hypothetical protein